MLNKFFIRAVRCTAVKVIISALFITIVGFITLTGCSVTNKTPSVYANIRSENGMPVCISVSVSGDEGISLNGLRVVAVNPADSALLLNYDSTLAAYTGNFEPRMSGIYTIRTSGTANYESKSIAIRHEILESKPEISILGDGNGNSALDSDELDHTTNIAAVFENVDKATVYKITIHGAGSIAFTGNVENNSIVIPAGTLRADSSYFISVDAQYIDGDPLFISKQTSSESIISGTRLYFRTAK